MSTSSSVLATIFCCCSALRAAHLASHLLLPYKMSPDWLLLRDRGVLACLSFMAAGRLAGDGRNPDDEDEAGC